MKILINVLAMLCLVMCGCDGRGGAAKPDGTAVLLRQLEALAVRAESATGGVGAAKRIREVAADVASGGAGSLSRNLYPTNAVLRRDEFDPVGLDALTMTYLASDAIAAAVEFVDGNGKVVRRSPVKQGPTELAAGVKTWVAFIYVIPSHFDPSHEPDSGMVDAGEIEGYPITRFPRTVVGLSVRFVDSEGRRSALVPIVVQEKQPEPPEETG